MDGHASVQNQNLQIEEDGQGATCRSEGLEEGDVAACDAIVLFNTSHRTPPALIVLLHVHS